MPVVELHVTADDRTGALECAAAIADRAVAPVPVSVWPDRAPAGSVCAVVDLASRHLVAADAADRAATLPAAGRLVHKIDSTLRGNWPTELATRHRLSGMPVLLVPALPALGRVCLGGEVFVGEHRAHEVVSGDPRGGVASSRPAELLGAVGAASTELADVDAVERWLASPADVAVADAADDTTVEAIAERWNAADGVLLAGTSAVVGAVLGRPVGLHRRRHLIQPPTLVVCGSVSPVAREQVAAAAAHGATITDRFDPDVLRAMIEGTPVVLASPVVSGPVTDEQAERAAERLVQEAAAVIESGHVGTLVIIGGDTAAALLGDALVVVHGSVRPGTALVESLVIDVPVITRAGGFGGPEALIDLLWARVPR